jgi:bacterioferritin-associated ferredoxin
MLRPMYVCICNGHRDSEIRSAAAESGLCCPRDVYTYLGKPPRCGRCLELASQVIQEARAEVANDDITNVA